MPTAYDIDNWFTYHPPKPDQVLRYETLREGGRRLAVLIDARCPDSRERDNAFSCLREAIMWANASVACNEGDP